MKTHKTYWIVRIVDTLFVCEYLYPGVGRGAVGPYWTREEAERMIKK